MQHLNIDERGPIYSMLLRPFTVGKRIHHRPSALSPHGMRQSVMRAGNRADTPTNGCISMQLLMPPPLAGGFILNNPKTLNLNNRNNLMNSESAALN